MTRLRYLGQAHRALFIFALAAILLVRIAVPQGWMPSAAGQWITICSGIGVQAAWIDSDGKIHKDAPDKTDPADCAFASIGALNAPTELAGIALLPLPTLGVERPNSAQIGQGLAAPPPPATGPPALP